jgi:uracil-DNA glycosylase
VFSLHIDDVLRQIDSLGRCASCDQLAAKHYCHTYIGPRYGKSTRVLIIGLDHGQDYTENASDRQKQILHYRQVESIPMGLNQHYRGCVLVAAETLGFRCATECARRCSFKAEEECALLHFAQGNAVKCTAGGEGMTFRRQERIRECFPLMLGEIQILRPHVIVLQGRNQGTGHIHEDFKKLAETCGTWEMTDNELLRVVRWGDWSFSSIVASFRHPSRGYQSRDWEPIIRPAIARARELLAHDNSS